MAWAAAEVGFGSCSALVAVGRAQSSEIAAVGVGVGVEAEAVVAPAVAGKLEA